MRKVGDLEVFSFEEILDENLGKRGSAARDDFEAQVEADVQAYKIGEAIREARKSKNLTQAELGEMMGVQRAQVSKLETGKNITFASIARAFKALGIPAKFAFGDYSVALW